MTFLNTGLLWGLALASIPVIIHLIRKNKVIEVEWAAMDFLMDIVEEQKKRFQMEDLLLLLLRVGVILFLVLALARPVIKSALGIGDTNTVLSIDDTYSMATVSGTQNRFNRASEAADAILGKMSGEGGSALVLHRANAKKIISSFSSDGDLMNETVSQLDVSDYHSNGPDGLKACLEILEKEKPASASVYFISDFQKAEWEEPSLEVMDIVKKLREKAEVIFVNAGDTEVDNLSVEEIRSLQDAVKVEETAWFAAKFVTMVRKMPAMSKFSSYWMATLRNQSASVSQPDKRLLWFSKLKLKQPVSTALLFKSVPIIISVIMPGMFTSKFTTNCRFLSFKIIYRINWKISAVFTGILL